MAEILTPTGIIAVAKNVDQFTADMNRMNQAMKQTGDNAEKAAKQQEKQAQATEQAWKAAQKASTVMLGFAAAGGAALMSCAKLAARVETLGIVTATLGKNVGKTEKEIRSIEKAIQDEGITTQASRQAIAMMIQANIDLAHSTEMAKLAQDAAVIANLNSSEAFETLVYTITSGNVRMARTLGLQVSFERGYKRMAEALDVTTDALTEEQRVEARVQEVMRAGINIQGAYTAAMMTAGKQLTSMPRYIEQIRLAFGESLLPMFAKAIFAINQFMKDWLALPEHMKRGQIAAVVAAVAFTAIAGAAIKVASVIKLTVIPALTKMTLSTALATGGLTLLLGAIGALIVKAAQEKAEIDSANESVGEMAAEAADAGKSYEEFHKDLENWAKENKLQIKHYEDLEIASRDYYGRLTGESIAYKALVGDIDDVTEAEYYRMATLQDLDQEHQRYLEGLTMMTEAEYAEARAARELAEFNEQVIQQRRDLVVETYAVASAHRGMWDAMKPDVAGMIQGWMDLIDFYQSGGYELQIVAQQIWQAMRSGAIGPGEAEAMFLPLRDAGLALSSYLGDESFWDLKKKFQDAGYSYSEAYAMAEEYFGAIPDVVGTKVDEATAIFSERMDPAKFEAIYGRLSDIPPEALMSIPESIEDAFTMYDIPEEMRTITEGVNFESWGTDLQNNLVQPIEDAKAAVDKLSESPIHIEAIVEMIATGEIPGYQYGGQFTVQGPPGADRVPVAFMASAGERVSITPPGQVDQSKNLQFGDVSIRSGMDEAGFDAMIRDWLGA